MIMVVMMIVIRSIMVMMIIVGRNMLNKSRPLEA